MMTRGRWWWIGMVSIAFHLWVLLGIPMTKPMRGPSADSVVSIQLLGPEDGGDVGSGPIEGGDKPASNPPAVSAKQVRGGGDLLRSRSSIESAGEARRVIEPVGEPSERGLVGGRVSEAGGNVAGGGGRIVEAGVGSGGGSQVTAPTYGQNPRPAYPEIARRRGYEGLVKLRVWVLRTGKVGTIQLVGSSGHMVLDQSATNAVMNWVFNPARNGEGAIDGWVTVPIRFSLTQG